MWTDPPLFEPSAVLRSSETEVGAVKKEAVMLDSLILIEELGISNSGRACAMDQTCSSLSARLGHRR